MGVALARMKMAPLLGQGGAASSQRLLPGWFETRWSLRIETQGLSLQPPLLGPWPSVPSSVEEGTRFSGDSRMPRGGTARITMAAPPWTTYVSHILFAVHRGLFWSAETNCELYTYLATKEPR